MTSTEIRKLTDALLEGDRAALSRLITRLENREIDSAAVLKRIFKKTGRARTMGITGPPGAGKSTLVNALIRSLRKQGERVAVIAVDPSSPFSGGALLGDRYRMQEHAEDRGVFIRSLGSRGHRGGLSAATREIALLMDAAGYDTILIETVGVGQTELDVLLATDTVAVVLVPESGDFLQVMKAGLMEIADLFVLNKADRPGADQMFRELQATLPGYPGGWEPAILQTVATDGQGMEEILKAVDRHRAFLKKSKTGRERRLRGARDLVRTWILQEVERCLEPVWQNRGVQNKLMQIVKKKQDPISVGMDVLVKFLSKQLAKYPTKKV